MLDRLTELFEFGFLTHTRLLRSSGAEWVTAVIVAVVTYLLLSVVAVALAVQNILGDLFASLSIALDKPFVIGDFIIVDAYLGTIEKVGLKTTRIRSLGGEQLIFSNSDLLSSRIRNLGRMKERRVALPLRVTFDASVEQIEEIPQMIRQIVEAIDQTRFDRSHLKEIGDSGYVFETIYWVLDPSYDVFMDVQQTLLLRLVRGLEEREITVAYPTRTVWLGADWQEVDAEQQPSAA